MGVLRLSGLIMVYFVYQYFLQANDSNIYKIEDGRVNYSLSDSKALEALQFFSGFTIEHEVMPPPMAPPQKRILFEDGQLAMFYGPPRFGDNFIENLDGDFGIVFFPKGPHGNDYLTTSEIFVGGYSDYKSA